MKKLTTCLLLTVAFLTTTKSAYAITPTKECQSAAIPAYFWPYIPVQAGSHWDKVLSTLTPGEIIIVNPADGSGTSISSEYSKIISYTKAKGIQNIGYVFTEYGTRSISEVKKEIDNYSSWYGINSIFLDEASTNISLLPYYQELYNYIKTRGGQAMLNPGTVPNESYMQVSNQIVIFEDNYSKYLTATFPDWIKKYSADRFVHLVYGTNTSSLSTAINLSKSRNAGYIFITDDSLTNPWDTMPGYWADEMTQKCPTVKPPVPTVTPTITPNPTPVSDTVAPSAKITSPISGSIISRGRKVTIKSTVSDNVGIAKIEFYVNGSLKCSSSSLNYCVWLVPSARNSLYTIMVKAYDKAGNSGSNSITVRSSR